jgi:hypothetical protein
MLPTRVASDATRGCALLWCAYSSSALSLRSSSASLPAAVGRQLSYLESAGGQLDTTQLAMMEQVNMC